MYPISFNLFTDDWNFWTFWTQISREMLQNVWKVWKRISVKKYIQVFKIYILSIVTHLQKLETWQKKSCKLLYRCIYLCQQDIKLYASNFNLIVQQKQFTVFDMSKNLFVVVNKCHLIWHLSSCSTCNLKGMSLWHFHQCRVVTSYGDICFCWYKGVKGLMKIL